MSATIAHFYHTKDIRLMPIVELQLREDVTGGDPNFIRFRQVEEESSFTLTPITRQSSRGGEVTVAYKFEATIYIPFNKFKYDADLVEAANTDDSASMIAVLERIKNKRVSVALFLGASSSAGSDIQKVINATASSIVQLGVKKCLLSYSITSLPLRPRLSIKITGFTKSIADNREPGSAASEASYTTVFT
jgi:hypothetical protein